MKTQILPPEAAPRRVSARCFDLTRALVLALAIAAAGARAGQVLLTFDELPVSASGSVLPVGYHNLLWSNLYCMDAVNYSGNPSGYQNGVVSGNQVAFLWGAANEGAAGEVSSDAGFDFRSGYFTAAWRDGLQLRVSGYGAAGLVYDNTYTLSTSAPTFISFNYYAVTRVTFSTSGGTHNAAYSLDGYHFMMDNVTVSVSSAVTPDVAGAAFDQLWEAFDRDYAKFVLCPAVDWSQSRAQYRPLATNSTSAWDLANVLVQTLAPFQDLHVWLTVSGSYVSTYAPTLAFNANPAAFPSILGTVTSLSPRVQWAVTEDKIGFIAINSWTDSATPIYCQQALEQMRDTRGLIVDVRANGGGSENLALQVAARFEHTNFVYAFDQVRNGTNHADLTAKQPRTISPRGPWRYDRPVVLLIGQRCVSSDESFVGMMTGATNVTTMGDHTCGASGNPETIQLPYDITATVSTWIDYLPDGSLLEWRGFQPQVPFTPGPGAFSGTNDALLSAAIAQLRPVPLPTQPILGPVFGPGCPLGFDDLVHKAAVPSPYGGVTWSNFYAYDAVTGVTPAYGIPMVSSPFVIYNGWGGPASITNAAPFDLVSGELAAVFYDNQNLEVKGYCGAKLIYDRNFTLSAILPTAVQFDCYGATAVSFVSSGGTLYRSGGEEQFAMDDLVLIPHPTPCVRPQLRNPTRRGGAMQFVWDAQAGQTYQVQYITDPSQTNWTNLGPRLTTGNYTLSLLDSCTNQQRFYRVLALP